MMDLKQEIELKRRIAKERLREEMEKRKVRMPLMETLIIRKEDGEEISLFEKERILWDAGGEHPLKNISLRIEKREYIPIPAVKVIKGKEIQIGFIVSFPKRELIKEIKNGKKEFAEFPYALIEDRFIPLEKLNLEKSLKELGEDIKEDYEKRHVERFLEDLEEIGEISPVLFDLFYDDETKLRVENRYLRDFLLSEKVLSALKEYLEEHYV